MNFFIQLLFCASLLPLSTAFLDFSACVFPFVYKNKTYSTCTKDGSKLDWLWCSTTSNFDEHHKWKRCYEREHGGNSRGKPCKFPFVYKKRKFFTCTDENARPRMFWCATTSNFDKDKKWSYCADTVLVGKSSSSSDQENGTLDQEKAHCNSSVDPRCLIALGSPEVVDRIKLGDAEEQDYSEYYQERDQDMMVRSLDPVL